MSGDGKWKMHIPHSYRTLITPGMDGQAGKYENREIELSLFDMENDPMESTNVIDKYPDVVEKMKKMADSHKAKFYAE